VESGGGEGDGMMGIALVRRQADHLAAVCYLRWGFVPRQVRDVVDALEALQKYRPDQPRVPAGNPEGGQWTDGGGSTRPWRVEDIYDPPLIPVYPLEMLVIPLLPWGSRLLAAWRVFAAFRRTNPRDTEWRLGEFKSAQRWANQIAKRGWTPEQITDMIAKGERSSAPNKVHPGNQAIRYQDARTGRFVVRDEVTKEILQISGSRFKANEVP